MSAESPSRVLVVEDDTTFARFLRAGLTTSGQGTFSVEAVERLPEALRVLERRSTDVILLDLELPGTRGFESLEPLLTAAPEIPIVVLTGTSVEGSFAIEAVRRGAEDYVFKGSVSQEVLARTLRYAVERRRILNRQKLLAQVGQALAGPLEFKAALDTIATTLVRGFADCCIIDMLEQGQLRRFRVAHRDARKEAVLAALETVQPDMRRPYLVRPAVEARRPVLLRDVPREYLREMALDEHHYQLLELLDPQSILQVPLHARGKLLGVLALMTSPPRHPFDEEDILTAEGLGDRISLTLENAQLLEATRLAVHMRDEVLGVVAHDLRNPLSIIRLSTHAVMAAESPGTLVYRRLEAASRAAERMARLITDLLDIARLEAGGSAIRPRLEPPHSILDEVFELEAPAAQAAELRFELDVPDGLPEIWGDRDQLIRVLINLVDNAIKFTPRGGHLELGARATGDGVEFFVADSGTGISSEHLEHVFDRFHQLNLDRRGTGLGLAIARGIVEAHGGRIWAESTLDQGSTFHFVVPLAALSWPAGRYAPPPQAGV